MLMLMSAADFKTRRILLHMTVSQFAKEIGISARSVQYIEAGKRPIPEHVEIKVRMIWDKRKDSL